MTWGFVARVFLTINLMLLGVSAATAELCVHKIKTKDERQTALRDEMPNQQCVEEDGTTCFDHLFAWKVVNVCSASVKVRLTAGRQVRENVFLGPGDNYSIDCLQAKDNCSDLSVELLSSDGKRTGKYVDNRESNNKNSESSFTGGAAGGGSDEGGAAKPVPSDLKKYCGSNRQSCVAKCNSWSGHNGYAACVGVCDHGASACTAAKRGDYQGADRELSSANRLVKELQELASHSQEEDMKEIHNQWKRQDQMFQNTERMVHEHLLRNGNTTSAQTHQSNDADLGYPPGCRNKRLFDHCALEGTPGTGTCSLRSRVACQDLCRGYCND